MKAIYLSHLLCTLTTFCMAQKTFILNNGSSKYNAEIIVDSCGEDNCEGKGIIKLIDKKTNSIFHEFTSENLYFFLDSNQRASVNIIRLYDEQRPLIFNDFNFDGFEDLAIRNGNNSSYGGPSYDVYVYNSTQKQFVMSEELTTLAVENLGMFQTDSKRKRLMTYAKSGCCHHVTTEYEVLSNNRLKVVYEFEEDAMGGGDFVKVTTRKFIKNKWVSKSRKYKLSDYYKE